MWRYNALGFNFTKRMKFRRQIAQVAVKKHSTFLNIFLEVSDQDVQHKDATAATTFLAAQCWRGEWNNNVFWAWRTQRFQAKSGKKVKRPAGAVCRELEDLRITWPSWGSMQRSKKSSTFCRSVHKMSNTRMMSGFFPSSNFLTWYPARKTAG